MPGALQRLAVPIFLDQRAEARFIPLERDPAPALPCSPVWPFCWLPLDAKVFPRKLNGVEAMPLTYTPEWLKFNVPSARMAYKFPHDSFTDTLVPFHGGVSFPRATYISCMQALRSQNTVYVAFLLIPLSFLDHLQRS